MLTRDRSMQMLNLIMKSIFILFYLEVCHGSLLFCKVLMFLEKKEKLLVGLTRNYIMEEVLDANVNANKIRSIDEC